MYFLYRSCMASPMTGGLVFFSSGMGGSSMVRATFIFSMISS